MSADIVDFDSIPVLDLQEAKTNKRQFLNKLQNALIHIGFFYVRNHGISADFLERLTANTKDFFDLSVDEKLKTEKIHSPTFLGYSIQGNEITKDKKDNREQYDFANELPSTWVPGEPEYKRLVGPNLWPSPTLVPDFRPSILSFHSQALELATRLIRLTAEALGLEPEALLNSYVLPNQQHRAKLIKYPAVDQLAPQDGTQGVGAHRDTGSLLTILYQATEHQALQVQNHSGKWISAPPVANTFVVNIGTGLEYLVQGVAIATTHRVINPPAGTGSRYSIAFFQGTRPDKRLLPVDLPSHIVDQKPKKAVSDSGYQFHKLFAENPGLYTLLNRISSHRDVGIKYYHQLAKQHGVEDIYSPKIK
ncbi:hypothetical protein J3B02_001140 [Coemansia erecta]|nr:hypothetical protein J3B02_001140 [Coemansia erecta]KAJ2882877.1 hypothetical protein FB639_002295 [Coemansia asiatica]